MAHSDKASAVVGTNVVYAPTHQFGAARGAFRGGRRAVPWGDIPARPFLGLHARHRRFVLRADTLTSAAVPAKSR